MKLKDFFLPSPKPTTSNFLSPQPSPNFHPFIPFSLIHVSFFLFSHFPVSFSLSLAPSHLPPTGCFSGFTFSFPIKAYISLLFSPLPLFYLSLSLSLATPHLPPTVRFLFRLFLSSVTDPSIATHCNQLELYIYLDF